METKSLTISINPDDDGIPEEIYYMTELEKLSFICTDRKYPPLYYFMKIDNRIANLQFLYSISFRHGKYIYFYSKIIKKLSLEYVNGNKGIIFINGIKKEPIYLRKYVTKYNILCNTYPPNIITDSTEKIELTLHIYSLEISSVPISVVSLNLNVKANCPLECYTNHNLKIPYGCGINIY